MGLLDQLLEPSAWQAFAAYKAEKGHLTRADTAALSDLIETDAYLPAARMIQQGHELPPPQKMLLNKLGTAKKRTVYSFEPELMWTLKLMAWLLFSFDDRQPNGCYSFRRGFGAHRAFRDIVSTPGINGLWCCKLDVADYFNSIDCRLLLPIVGEVLAFDPALVGFFKRFLTADTAYFEGRLVHGQRGVMAGTPTSPFLANLYLRDLDGWFTSRGLPYARYSDDIIFFARSEDELGECRAKALEIIASQGLEVNQEKSHVAAPGEAWEFLGLAYKAGEIDLGQVSKAKLKGKIRRKARSLRRWMLKKPATAERASRALIRSFNRKFYDARNPHDLTWSRWFFPLLTTSAGIREIDHYLLQYIRYISTGRFNKANYRLGYQQIKELGYLSLVHEYYRERA